MCEAVDMNQIILALWLGLASVGCVDGDAQFCSVVRAGDNRKIGNLFISVTLLLFQAAREGNENRAVR